MMYGGWIEPATYLPAIVLGAFQQTSLRGINEGSSSETAGAAKPKEMKDIKKATTNNLLGTRILRGEVVVK